MFVIHDNNSYNWTTMDGYTITQFYAFLIGTYTWPLTIICFFLFALQSYKQQLIMYKSTRIQASSGHSNHHFIYKYYIFYYNL